MKNHKLIHFTLMVLLLITSTCKREYNNVYDKNSTVAPESWTPTNFTYTMNNNNIVLSWSASAIMPEGYKIDKATNDVWQNDYTTVPANTATYIDTAVNPFTNTYAYRIYAYAGSQTSNQKTVSVNKVSFSIGINFSAITDTSMTLTSTINVPATILEKGFCYGLNTNPQISGITVATSTNTYTAQKLQAGKIYYAVAYIKTNKGKIYSSEQKTNLPVWKIPTVFTLAASTITYTGATISGTANSDSIAITEHGFYYGLTTNPQTTGGTKIIVGTGNGSFSSNLTNLTNNTKYVVVAYAKNIKGLSYGNEISFTTTAYKIPTVSTTTISNITYTTATSGGNITDDGGVAVTARGVCWSTSSTPTILNNHTTDGTGTGSFISNITGLTAGTTYYVCTYATNSIGTAYGVVNTFRTIAFVVPTVITSAITNISYISATCSGNVTFDGGTSVLTRGICWGTSHNPTIADSYTNVGTGIGTYSANLSGLNANTAYYVRAFATNFVGSAYGREISFNTLATTIPAITTDKVVFVLDLLTGHIDATGTIISDGGTKIIERGFCWNPNSTPTISDSHIGYIYSGGSNTYTLTLTGAGPGNWFRAYAINSVGVAYGNLIQF